ncbi:MULTISPECIES: hypothetical protein [unclassified Coleofasciculus]|uniref:hypothetical protein n=1 Tax=unclassified Coleofasciculus TaxID=2692782 RepID=UPI001D143481|nr:MULTISPECIES: hypothetical protein [unclassified Coleofasciculus]
MQRINKDFLDQQHFAEKFDSRSNLHSSLLEEFLAKYVKNSINPVVVQHLFKKVRNHLTMDWAGGIEFGIQRGWLIDE